MKLIQELIFFSNKISNPFDLKIPSMNQAAGLLGEEVRGLPRSYDNGYYKSFIVYNAHIWWRSLIFICIYKSWHFFKVYSELSDIGEGVEDSMSGRRARLISIISKALRSTYLESLVAYWGYSRNTEEEHHYRVQRDEILQSWQSLSLLWATVNHNSHHNLIIYI